MSPDLAPNFNQKWPLLDKEWDFHDTALIAGTIKLFNWLALTMSYNMSESQRMRVITLTSIVILVHLKDNIGHF